MVNHLTDFTSSAEKASRLDKTSIEFREVLFYF